MTKEQLTNHLCDDHLMDAIKGFYSVKESRKELSNARATILQNLLPVSEEVSSKINDLKKNRNRI
jgi:hypothetical protein